MAQIRNFGLSLDPAVAVEFGGSYGMPTAHVLTLDMNDGLSSYYDISITLTGLVKPASPGSIKKGAIIGRVPETSPIAVMGRRLLNCRTNAGVARVDIDENRYLVYNDDVITAPTYVAFDGIAICPDTGRG